MGKIYSKIKVIIFVLVVLGSNLLKAQVDVSTGGPATTYTNVSSAFAAINAGTHTGMINIIITGNTTEPSTPTALEASGVGLANYSSIKLNPSVTATISGTPVSGRSVIEINGADSITIDGDILGGTINRDLTIINSNLPTVTLTSVIRLIGTTTAPALGCRNNIIKNCIVIGNVNPTATAPVTSIAGILAGGGTGATITGITTGGNNFDKLLIENNEVKKSYYGVLITGGTTSTVCTDSLVIRKNLIGSADTSQYNLFRGIYLSNCLGAKIYDNTVFNQKPLNATTIAGIEILGSAAVASNDSIVRNFIYGIHMPSSSGFGAYGINIASGTNHTILNNVVYDIKTTNYSSTSTTFNAFGIRIASGTGHKIYYNSVNMFGNNTGTNTTCASAALVVTSGLSTSLDIKNNIFNNKMTSTATTKRFYAVWFPASYNFTSTNLNNNAYMVLGPATSHYVGTIGAATQITLADWKIFSQFTNPTNDINSVPPANGAAPFIADNNLNIANNTLTLIESGATILPALGLPNTDVLLNARPMTGVNPNTNPDMGAYEFDGINGFIDVGVSAILKPLDNGSKCFNGTDTIKLQIKNNHTATHDISVRNIPVKVIVSGPNPQTYTLALTSGTLAGGATLDTTITLNYDMSRTGIYNFKAFTELPFDASSANDTITLSITKKPIFTITATPNDSVCRGTAVQLQVNTNTTNSVGTGTIVNTSTSYPAPYGNFYEGARHQFLFLASELSASGLVAGNINSISFNATNLNASDPLINYNVAVSTTTLISLSAIQTTGFTTYFSTPSYTPVVGTNLHTFSTPFVWDGVSNIIIETCFNNTPNGFSNNVSVSQSTTPFVSSIWYRMDGDPSVCSSTTVSGSMSQRPNVNFGQPSSLSYNWGPASGLSATNISNPLVASLNNTSVYTVTLTNNTSGCSAKDTIQLFVKPTPSPSLGNDSLFCSLPVTINANTAASNYLWNTGSIGSSLNVTSPGKYWVRATNTNGCVATDTMLVSLGYPPVVTLGADTAYCQGGTIKLYAGYGIGNVYQWNTGATTSSITVGTTGTYSVVVTNTLGCKASDTINVTSKPLPSVSLVFGGQTSFCPTDLTGRPLTEGTPSGGTYIGGGVTGNTFYPNQATQGTHVIIYSYTGANGCSNTAKDTLKVNACVGVEELTDNIGLNVYPNPNSGIFTLELNSSSDIDGHVHLMSIDGKLIYTEAISGNGLIKKSINISELADGIYYLRIETKTAVKTFKVLKQ